MRRRDFLKVTAAGMVAGSFGHFLSGQFVKASEKKSERGKAMPGESMSAEPLAQDYTVVARTPSKDVFLGGPGLVKLPSGSLLATLSFLPRRGWPQEYTSHIPEVHLARSGDKGQTWKMLVSLPYYTSTPFVYNDRLYLFAHRAGREYRNDDILILRSDDEGETWSQPVTLFKGHFWNCPTGIVIANGQIYRAVDRMDVPGGDTIHSRGTNRGEVVIAGDLSRDLMDPESWRISQAVGYPGTPASLRRGFPTWKDRWLEPNVVNVRGRLMILSRVRIAGQSTANLCGVCDLEDDGEKMDLRFTQFYPVPGGQNKLHIIYDDVSRLFWTPATLVTDSQSSLQDLWKKAGISKWPGGNERRILMLMYSMDALNWFQAGCIAIARKLHQSFNYASPLIDGDDILIISRTSKDGASQHDADLNTFHIVRNFRSLALNLYPQM